VSDAAAPIASRCGVLVAPVRRAVLILAIDVIGKRHVNAGKTLHQRRFLRSGEPEIFLSQCKCRRTDPALLALTPFSPKALDGGHFRHARLKNLSASQCPRRHLPAALATRSDDRQYRAVPDPAKAIVGSPSLYSREKTMHKFITSMLFLGVLFVGSQAYAQGQCTQGSTYCNNGYEYLCVCWTGRPCYWMYSGRCR